MKEIVPWLIIIAALAAFAIVNAQENTNENSKNSKLYRFIKGLCIMLSTGAFMYLALKWELWICIGCEILLGIGGFHLGVDVAKKKVRIIKTCGRDILK